MSETTTLNAASYTTSGKKRESVSLPADVFDGVVNMPVMHHAVKAFLSNQRLGLASTKTRGLVAGGNQKPWKQKGTGRARAGSTRSPVFVGGGTVFGPRPRSYSQSVPKKVRQLARKSALNARAREDALIVIGAIGAVGKKVLLLTDGVKPNVFLSGRNVVDTHVMPYSDVSTYHILWSDVVVIEAEALGAHVEGSKRAARDESEEGGEVKAPATALKRKGSGKAATKAAAKSAKKKEAKAPKKAAKKSAKKAAAKKPAAKKKKGK
jgi:large subunit ribosomal protein L4